MSGQNKGYRFNITPKQRALAGNDNEFAIYGAVFPRWMPYTHTKFAICNMDFASSSICVFQNGATSQRHKSGRAVARAVLVDYKQALVCICCAPRRHPLTAESLNIAFGFGHTLIYCIFSYITLVFNTNNLPSSCLCSPGLQLQSLRLGRP